VRTHPGTRRGCPFWQGVGWCCSLGCVCAVMGSPEPVEALRECLPLAVAAIEESAAALGGPTLPG